MPSKPLEPTKNPDGTKELNGITYKPNGSNFDIVDSDTKEVTNTVDAMTLKVLTGKEIPTTDLMKKIIAEKFDYLKGEPKYTYDYGTKEITAAYGDETNGLTVNYDLETGGKTAKNATGKIDQFLKDTSPGTIAQLNFDAEELNISPENFDEKSITDELSKKLVAEDWLGAAELLAEQPNPDPKTLALIMRLNGNILSQVNADKLPALKSKIGAAKIIQIWKENDREIGKENVKGLELLNGGDLDSALQDAVIDCRFEGASDRAFFYEKYESNPKVVEWCLKEGLASGYANFPLILKDYTGQLSDSTVVSLADSYSNIDNLDLKDDEKTALKEKAKKYFAAYLEAHAKDGSAEKHKEIYEILYGSDITKLQEGASKPSPDVYARYFILASQDPFAAGIFDGTGWLASATDSQETQKYVSAYLEVMAVYSTDSIPENQPNPAEKKSVASVIMELGKQSKRSYTQIFAAEIEFKAFASIESRDQDRFNEIKNLKRLVENKDENALVAVIVLQEQGGLVQKMLESKSGRKALGFENKDQFDKWVEKQKALIQFEQGKFNEIDANQLDDPIQKEFMEMLAGGSKFDSITKLRRIAKEVPAENLKALLGMANGKWGNAELYLALGFKGDAKEYIDKMDDAVAKNYYLSLLAEKEEDKKTFLENAVKAIVYKTPLETADLELRTKILRELPKADQYKYTVKFTENGKDKTVEASILENLAGMQMVSDPDKVDYNAAVLDVKLLNAEVEMAECEDKGNPFERGTKGACDYRELVREVKAYSDSLPEGQAVDKAMLERLYKLIGSNLTLLQDDEDAKKTYANLMTKIDKTEGLDAYLTQDAAYLEKKGKFLDAAKLLDLDDEANIPKKKALLKQALEVEKADKTLVAAEYESINDEESNKKAVDLYLEAGKYDEAIESMKGLNDSYIGFIKSKINDLVKADQASKAVDLLLAKGLYDQLIDQEPKVYKIKEIAEKLDVKLGLLLTAAMNQKLSYNQIFELLNTEDGRTKDQFTGASDEMKKLFINAKRSEITANDTTRKRIEFKLGIKVEDVPEDESTEPEPASTEAPAETPTDHTYTIKENKVTIKTISGTTYTVSLKMPENLRAELFEDSVKKKKYVYIYDEDKEPQAQIRIKEGNKIDWGYVNHDKKDSKYELSYDEGIFTITKKLTKPEPQPQQQPANQPETRPTESPTPPPTSPETPQETKEEEEATEDALEALNPSKN